MSLYQSAVRRPVTTIMIFVGVVVLGLFALTRLPIDLLPDMQVNRIMIVTSYSGAAPEEVENNVTKPIQNVLNGINGVKHITSQSKENVSVVTLELREGLDIESAINDTRDKISAITEALPDGAGTPNIIKFGMDDIPILMLSIKSDASSKSLYKILNDQLITPLGRIDGVGGVNLLGARQRQINVYCDPHKLESYGITVGDVSNLIAVANRNVSAGSMNLETSKISLRAIGEIVDPKQLEELPITSFGGQTIYLRDVASVVDGDPEQQTLSYVDNQRGAMLMLMKQSGANTVQVNKRVLKALPQIVKNLPSDIKIEVVMDQSDFIVRSINSLSSTIAITFCVVMFIVLLFLGRWRATFIIVLTIPISLLSAFIYLLLTGNSLNIISLSSLSIAIGMVVDDAIVVLENITNHIERGSYPKQAAVHATNEVALSVIASTLTMLAVFLPMVMMQGMAGLLFRQLGWIVSIVMIVSTICALALTPTLCAHMLRANRQRQEGRVAQKILRPFNDFIQRLTLFYQRTLAWVLRHKWLTVGLSLAIFVLSLTLGSLVKTEFMPQGDSGYIFVKAYYPVGTTIDRPLAEGHRLTDEWRKKYPEIAMLQFSTGQADAFQSGASTLAQDNADNILSFSIKLVEANQRTRSTQEVAAEIRRDLSATPGIKQYNVSIQTGGGGQQSTVNVDIYGHDFAVTDQISKAFMAEIRKSPACAQALSNRDEFMPEYQVLFDPQRLAEHGLTNSMVASYLRNSIYGATASFYREDGQEYEIRVRLAPEFRRSLDDVAQTLVRTPQGTSVRLGELGKVEEHFAPPAIYQKDRSRVVTIALTPAPKAALSDLVRTAQKTLDGMDMPEGVSYEITGAFEQQQEAFADLGTLLLLIVFLVFIVMAAEFESLASPFVIMFSVPFAFTGVILGLLLTGVPLSIIAFIGAIMLVGIVVKNGIVLIDYTILNRERGMSVRTALLHAGASRLRPVLMTTLTTVFGMIPMAIGIGEGSEMWQPMGVTVAFGLTISTLVTLLLIPCIYALVSRRQIRRRRKKSLKNNHL
ncbi:heavy metal efflux pump, CzcA family [Porphyromonas uenonis 60-3]|uniref:Heavy metal efflux pump, CzcA family n=1 Tax=Porphyromonas uenonis 60-3 TaxID=596327 RepID=C2MB65_9PORP|nr:efflux RND transporter permease subunit [Porphyromonas uenonis]EEK17052.1 heavy metal efflux pump, CzcA family [Porphyromonas uenonis 60-3]